MRKTSTLLRATACKVHHNHKVCNHQTRCNNNNKARTVARQLLLLSKVAQKAHLAVLEAKRRHFGMLKYLSNPFPLHNIISIMFTIAIIL